MALYAFDGTWNEDEEGEGRDTNVVKMVNAYGSDTFYLEGVGTRLGFLGKLFGGIAGAGGKLRIREALEALDKNFDKGDYTIDVIGFSRGAAMALHFANEVKEEKGAEVRFLGI